MQGWQIDLMIAQEAEAAWNRLNAPDPEAGRMKKAAVDMKAADEFLSIVTDRLAEAMGVLDGTPMSDKVVSFLTQIEDIQCDLFSLTEKYGRGERE
jgi:hypothetical protein